MSRPAAAVRGADVAHRSRSRRMAGPPERQRCFRVRREGCPVQRNYDEEPRPAAGAPRRGRGEGQCFLATGGRASGRSTRSIACAICRLPLLMSTTMTLGLRDFRSLSCRKRPDLVTRTLIVGPAAVFRWAPFAFRAILAVMVLPGTTW